MCHVLIIEDEILVALNIAQLLQEHGATSYDIAETEIEAVEYAVANPPSFISSDVHLRIGFGPQAVKTIFERIGERPVVFVTASPDHCDPCSPPGHVMTKPLNEAAYCKAFKELVRA